MDFVIIKVILWSFVVYLIERFLLQSRSFSELFLAYRVEIYVLPNKAWNPVMIYNYLDKCLTEM